MSVDATSSQHKRNSNQSRPNVAQPNPSNKKNSSNKQNQIQNQSPQNSKQNQNQNQQLSKSAAPAAAPPPKTKSPPPPAELEPHVSLEGFNGDQIDVLLNGGEENVAEHYKMEKPPTNKQAAWAQKRE
ncbi:hypothetical protein LTS08_000238 [Lithohypha guttulata]|uniref:uncharacterized protein n=1 Tax=Lithohypha guttulata TaxID=1690604 RepID=UPI002DE0E4E7|nr:hypothetical protein LTR51_007139 [Lithohypha guttulata]KAK5106121.1 hypothetical protein LTS08_000238 [Lithohypha guttulata]